MIHRPKSHQYITLVLEFINWAMFFAVWIAISVNIGKDQECVAADGGHSHSRECRTIYSALAFAIINWILFTVTLGCVAYAVSTGRENVVVHEKRDPTAAGGPVRPSDDGTLGAGAAA
jgi:hypothetical protein